MKKKKRKRKKKKPLDLAFEKLQRTVIKMCKRYKEKEILKNTKRTQIQKAFDER